VSPLPCKSFTRSSGFGKRVSSRLADAAPPPNHPLERTQPQRGFMYDVAVLRRSARGR
jgi:hypothetical protein